MNEFLEACGLNGPLRLEIGTADGFRSEPRALDQPYALVGRSRDNDLHLDDPAVSLRHAYLQVIAGQVFCADLESRTGTRWEDGTRPWGWLPWGHTLRVGSSAVRLSSDAPDLSPTSEQPPTSQSFRQEGLVSASLEILGEAKARFWKLSRPLVFAGRSTWCKLRLAGPRIAGLHAGFVRTPRGTWVVDLLGPAGVLVNGRPARCTRLSHGDEIAIGDFRFRLLGDGRDDAPDSRARLPARRDRPAPPALAPSPVSASGADVEPAPPGDERAAWAPPGVYAPATSLIGEFRDLQKQAGDQFQNALMMMFQLFQGMHQEQMALIREELDRLHALNETERALRADLQRRSYSGQGPGPPLRLVFGASEAVTPLPRPAPPVAPGTGTGAGPDSEPKPSPVAGIRRVPRPAGEPPVTDLHADIMRKIEAIQGERQGRWQKLIRSLVGGGGDGGDTPPEGGGPVGT